MKYNKSCNADEVDVSFVKAGAVIMAFILFILSNPCLKFGAFSSNLK